MRLLGRDPGERIALWEDISTVNDDTDLKLLNNAYNPSIFSCSPDSNKKFAGVKHLLSDSKNNQSQSVQNEPGKSKLSFNKTSVKKILKRNAKSLPTLKQARFSVTCNKRTSIPNPFLDSNHGSKTWHSSSSGAHNVSNDNTSAGSTDLIDILKSNKSKFEELRVPILGSPSCGKTTLVEQFVNCNSSVEFIEKTKHPSYYYPVVNFNEHCFNLRLIDCPPLTGQFPTSTLEEWSNFRGWCLRAAVAYILVFDVTSEESFQFIRNLREQILAENIDVPLIVVANKIDLLQANNFSGLSNSAGFKLRHSSFHSNSSGHRPSPSTAFQTANSGRWTLRRDLTMYIKKQWKGSILIECSAKYNWRVLKVFKELMKQLEHREVNSNKPKANPARAMQNVWRRKQCVLL